MVNKRVSYCALALLPVVFLTLLSLYLIEANPVRADPGTRYVAPPPTGHDSGINCANASSPCATIQRAIDQASPGDEIRIAGGTYSNAGTVAVIAKSLTMIGAFDPAFNAPDPDMYETVLDAQWGGSVISMASAGDVMLQHLTVTHGDGTGNCGSDGCGGGIYASETSLQVGHCVMTDNIGTTSGWGSGGGIYAYDSDVVIWESQILSNTANLGSATLVGGHGGGVCFQNGVARLENNHILDNLGDTTYWSKGGGLALYNLAMADVLTNTIRGNRATASIWHSHGGGLFIAGSSNVHLSGNWIENNSTNPATGGGRGGGISVWGSDVTMARNIVIGNSTGGMGSSSQMGGGVYIEGNQPMTVANNLIALNEVRSAGQGGGVNVTAAQDAALILLVNNTIADNDADGVVVWNYATLIMTNNLIAGHAKGVDTDTPFSGTVTADTNLFWNDSENIVGSNPIQQDPLLKEDYRLHGDSPAVDAGAAIMWLTDDLDGNTRPHGSGHDIGAYEFYAWQYLPLAMKRY